MRNDARRDARTPNSAAQDRAAGSMQETKGRVKESFGALTGNERLEVEGRSDQVAGATRRKKGAWKARIKGWIDRL